MDCIVAGVILPEEAWLPQPALLNDATTTQNAAIVQISIRLIQVPLSVSSSHRRAGGGCDSTRTLTRRVPHVRCRQCAPIGIRSRGVHGLYMTIAERKVSERFTRMACGHPAIRAVWISTGRVDRISVRNISIAASPIRSGAENAPIPRACRVDICAARLINVLTMLFGDQDGIGRLSNRCQG